MSLVRCTIEDVVMKGDNNLDVESVQATCSKCGNIASSWGRSGRSIRRCFVMLRDTCPEGFDSNNFYDEG